MKNFRISTVVLAVTATAALTLAGCSSSDGKSDTSSSDSSGDSSKPVTISYFSWSNEKAMRPVIDAFEKKYPNIHIDISATAGGANAYAQTLTTRITGNQIPDVFHMSTATRHEIMDNGYALDLTNEPFMKGIDKSAKAFYTKDGKVYGMSPTAWMGVLIYNKDIIKKAGYDKVPTTIDEFNQMGKKITEQGKIAYMEDPSVISGSFCAMLPGYYAKHDDKDGDEAIWENKATFKEKWGPALESWDSMVKSGTIPSNVVGVSNDQIKQQFLTGNLAMYRSGLWDYKDLKASGINFEAAPFPALKGGEPYIGGGPDSPFTINAKLKGAKLKAAEKFLSFINSAEGLKILESSANFMPTSSKYAAEVPEQFQYVLKNYALKGKYGWINWGGNGPAMSQDMVSQWQLLIQGKATPDSVLEHLQQTWNSGK